MHPPSLNVLVVSYGEASRPRLGRFAMYNPAMPGTDDVRRQAAVPGKLTYDDYVRFPDDRQRHELIDGEHVVTPSPRRRHQQISSRLHVAVGSYLLRQPRGQLYAAPFDVILSWHDVVEPDLVYVSNERRQIVADWVHGAPDLVIEILSPSTRAVDESAKLRLYERFDVTEYWLVDPEREVVVAHRRRKGTDGFSDVAEFTREANAVITTPLLPGFELAVAELFEE